MQEIKMKDEQEISKNIKMARGAVWVSGVYNLLVILLIIFSIISSPRMEDPTIGIALFTMFIAVPTLVVSVPVFVINFNKLINLNIYLGVRMKVFL